MKIEVRGTCGPITIENGITAAGQNMRFIDLRTDASPAVWIDNVKVWPIEEKKPEPANLERKPIVLFGCEAARSCRSWFPLLNGTWLSVDSGNGHSGHRNQSEKEAAKEVADLIGDGWTRVL